MAKAKICKKCKIFVNGDQCPVCKTNNNFTESWKGKVVIIDPVKSEIAEKMGFKAKGDYAIKI